MCRRRQRVLPPRRRPRRLPQGLGFLSLPPLFHTVPLISWPLVLTHWVCHLCVGRGGWLQNDLLAVKVNQLSSIKTQLPYSYYSLPFCRPDTIVNSAENLGQVLRGDRIENSPYVVIPLGLQQLCNCYHSPPASCFCCN
jgi:hypothetical protein